jgi:SAM-dependent methyltransferase
MRWLLRELRDWWVGVRDVESRAFDREYGVETLWFDLFNYEPSVPSVVRASLDALDVSPSDYTFVDLGSGKGRVVFLAAEHDFHEVVGIEHRAALHHRASENLAHLAPRLKAPIELIHGDAAQVPLPDGPLVLYLFNPFPAEVLIGVLARVDDRARLIYVHPVEAGILEQLGWTELCRVEDPDVIRQWRIYEGPYG